MSGAGERALVRGEQVWLRAFEREDLAAYQAAITDVEVALHAGYISVAGSDGVADWYENRVRPRHGKDEWFFVISPLGSREFTGSCWLWNFDSRLGGAELSIFVADPERWGAGLGTDAVKATLDFAFGFIDLLERVWLTTDADNRRAQRAFEKAGFRTDGRVRRHVRRRGQWIDSVLMSVLREEWEALTRPRSWELGQVAPR